MKKYIFTSLLSLFIITGAALGLTPQASAQPVDWEKHFLDGAENDPSV